jgi:hypothetical protein
MAPIRTHGLNVRWVKLPRWVFVVRHHMMAREPFPLAAGYARLAAKKRF